MALVALLVVCFLLALVGRSKKRTPPKRTEQQDRIDEQITIILPIINKDN